ncbi:hypothetical protein BKA70DRAFT_460556 [Coprinopsis sp. MPI-PUGE-AT-0042]|nr:hypothetical protein BKA70DRAFT_460556 [Coprinopsis sp. MPI-PUGE-AT-0042]
MAEDQVSRSTHTETSLGIDLTTNQVIPENSNDSWIIDAQDAKLFRRIIFQSHPPDFPIATISESTPWPIPPGSQSQPSADYPIIHPLLNAEHSRHDFFFDLANPMFVPCRVVGPSGEMVPITAEELFQPACHPPIYNLKVTSEKLPDEWAIEMAYQPQGHPSPEAHLPTSPNATGQPPITVGDVLLQTHRALHLRITHDDWNALDTADERKITKAFYTRCNAGGQSQRDWLVSQGVKRVDYLLEKRLFKGLVRTGTTFDELKLITAKDSFAIGSFAIGSFANRNVARRSSA